MIPSGVCAERRRAGSADDRAGPGAAPTWSRCWATYPKPTGATADPVPARRRPEPVAGSSVAAA